MAAAREVQEHASAPAAPPRLTSLMPPRRRGNGDGTRSASLALRAAGVALPLRSGLREWLPMIAAGKLAAEAVVAFAGQNRLLRILAELPLAQQRAYVRGEEIVVATFGPAGGFASEKLPVCSGCTSVTSRSCSTRATSAPPRSRSRCCRTAAGGGTRRGPVTLELRSPPPAAAPSRAFSGRPAAA